MLIGGLAVIARGAPRHTTDVDATVWAPGLDISRALAAFQDQSIVPRVANVQEVAAQAQILLLTHPPSAVDLDVSLAWMPFEEEALDAATPVDFGEKLMVPTARPEDLVIYKVVPWRERDRTDIERLLLRHGDTIDLGRVRRHVRQLAELLENPERADEFEAILKRSGLS